MLHCYICKLRDFRVLSLDHPENLAADYFNMVLSQIGHCWRRFYHKHQCFPYILWQLCGLTGDDLYAKCAELLSAADLCAECLDIEFSTCLVSRIPHPYDPHNATHQEKTRELQNVLETCAMYCPISTDQVETLHGFMQSKLSRVDGLRPTDEVAKELSLWGKISATYATIRTYVWDRTGDPLALRRLSHSRRFKHLCETSHDAQSILQAVVKTQTQPKKLKRLCGYFACHPFIPLLRCSRLHDKVT